MGRKTIAVSITEEQAKFISEVKDINPSHILQNRLNEIMETSKSPEFIKQIQDESEQRLKTIKHWQEMFYKLKEFAISRTSEQEVNNLFL